MHRTWVAGLIGLALMTTPGLVGAQDILKDADARQKIEAQRVEREFTEQRGAAYRRVRANAADLSYALDTIEGLLGLVRDSKALNDDKRGLYERTLAFDKQELRKIAAAGRRDSIVRSAPPPSRREPPPPRVSDDGSGRTKRVEDMLKDRRRMIADSRGYKGDSASGRLKIYEGVGRSAVPQSETYKFPRNWKELSKKRSAAAKMTATERAIMAGLNKVYGADYDKSNLQDVIDHLRKVTGLRFTLDKRGLEEAGASYETTVTLKDKMSLRSILKKMTGELGLAYVIKDETILITSQAQASRMTTLRTYYLGDLAAVTDINLDPITSQLVWPGE